MGGFNLNLSTRPFPAYRVANLGLFVFFVIVVGVSAWQAYSFKQYSSRAKSIRAEEQKAQVDKGSLGTQLDELSTRLDRPVTTAKLAEIDFLNGLIVRKHFSWTQLFANLEGVIPDNVHLNTIAPEISKEKVNLKLEIQCRSIADESEFIRRLQATPVFQDVVVTREERKGAGGVGEVNVAMSVSYFPERASQ